MLRIERVEICGFKSFSDRTEVRFPGGITAVVGPNGCGKSNIGDAINWVLGEQSPKMLRGTQMADVIFNGTRERKPLGMAEVSLHLGGAEGLPHSDQGQVVLTRRLFRSGESEYLLNGARARLKEIQDLLREAKVGARTYATIEQGRIDQVLNAKPRERRALIEDAAGVSGYKHKRRLAELKLEATQANLLRVQDIVQEVRRQINSLKRQAARARRYRRLREALRAKECLRFGRRAGDMERELAALGETEARARDAEARAAAGMALLEASLVQGRQALDEAHRALRALAERVHELDLGIDREEVQIRTCRERIAEAEQSSRRQAAEAERLAALHQDAAARLLAHRRSVAEGRFELEQRAEELDRGQAALQQAERARRALGEEIEELRRRQFESMARAAELRNGRRSAEEALERTRAQLARLEGEREQARKDWSLLSSRSAAASGDAAQQRQRVEQLREGCAQGEVALAERRRAQAVEVESLAESREQEQSALARVQTLEDVETRFAGVSDGVRSLLAAGAPAGIRTHGVVADYVEASREVEGAAESYLQWLLPTVILEDDTDARRAAELLRSEGAGRTWLISRTQPAGALAVGSSSNGRGALPGEMLRDKRVLGRLREQLTLKAAANGAVADRIGDAVLVDSLESALALHRDYPSADYLTPQGEVVYASGVISAGGQQAMEQGLLAHRRRLNEAQADLVAASAKSAGLQDTVEAGRAETDRLEVELQQRRLDLEQARARELELRVEAERSTQQTEHSGRRSEVLAAELESLTEESERLLGTLARMQPDVEAAEQSHQTLERALAGRTALLEQDEQERKRLAEQVGQLRAEQAARRQRQDSDEQEEHRLGEEAVDLEARRAACAAEERAANERATTSAELSGASEAELARALGERGALTETTARMEQDVRESEQSLGRQEGELRSLRGELDSCREATRAAEIERTRAEAARAHLDELCLQELGIRAGEAAPGEAAAEVDLEALEAEIQEIRLHIERIGPVNMTAIDEFSELEQRHGFLSTQREDLEQSMASLRDTIGRINRQSREHFREAFDAIRANFQEIYKLLFNGGRADLQLEEGEDVLECGIEILAQPPGKRLASIQLLSGGEKALSAIALLFAIFRYQPSPFCLLDEVDAPLDDTNVVRFARMVRQYAERTQFIIVTHNKLTMDAADMLYGVTMEEPGMSKVISLQLQ